MKYRVLSAAVLFAVAALSVHADDELLTVAEKSDFTATSYSAEVIEFARELTARSNDVRLTWMGHSTIGKPIPLLILGRPAPASPAELIGDDRLCVFIQANIHAGEVEGKEAVLMLARDILLTDKYPGLLDKLVILIAPNLNTEGNDHIDPANRRYQGGPEKGVGLRYTDQGYDINRDWIKLETPEARATVALLNAWNPAILVDCHTTNGSHHRHPITFAPAYNPSGDAEVLRYNCDVLMPDIDKRLKDNYDYEAIPYGNFIDREDPTKGWGTFSHHPRYTTNYVGLRNRLAVLIETYAYADYRTRVLSNYGYIDGILKHCAENKDEIAALLAGADARAAERNGGLDSERDRICLGAEQTVLPEPLEILSYEFEKVDNPNSWERLRPTEVHKTYSVPHYGGFKATEWEAFGAAYIVPAAATDVVEKLRQHGIAVERLTRAATLKVQRFKIEGIESAERIYQGHLSTSLKGAWAEAEEQVPEGVFVVRTAQPLGTLAAYMLEPRSDDGLVTWNYLDRYLTRQWGGGFGDYPVLRIMDTEPLPTEMLPH